MTVASYEDVAVALGRSISIPEEVNQVRWWLAGAEIVVRSRYPDLSALDQEVLKYVEVEAVVGKIRRHGRDESSITVTTDDSSVTRRYENPVTAADFHDAWWDLLDPVGYSDAFTISPYHGRSRVYDAEW